MNITNKEIREIASKSIKGKYGQIIIAMCIFLATGSINSKLDNKTLSLIMSYVSQIIFNSFAISLLRAYRNDTYNFKEIFEVLSKHTKMVLIISAITTIVTFISPNDIFLSLFWAVIYFIYQINFAYIPYVIEDYNFDNIIDYFKKAYELINGDRFNLIKLDLYYLALPILTYCLLLFALLFTQLNNLVSDIVFIWISLFVVTVFTVLYMFPKMYYANAVFYDNKTRGNIE